MPPLCGLPARSQLFTYVDDRTLSTRTVEDMQDATLLLRELDALSGQMEDAGKEEYACLNARRRLQVVGHVSWCTRLTTGTPCRSRTARGNRPSIHSGRDPRGSMSGRRIKPPWGRPLCDVCQGRTAQPARHRRPKAAESEQGRGMRGPCQHRDG